MSIQNPWKIYFKNKDEIKTFSNKSQRNLFQHICTTINIKVNSQKKRLIPDGNFNVYKGVKSNGNIEELPSF